MPINPPSLTQVFLPHLPCHHTTTRALAAPAAPHPPLQPRHLQGSWGAYQSTRRKVYQYANFERSEPNANISTAPSYDPKYSEPRRTLQSTTPKYESTLITPDTSRSRTKSTYGEPAIRDKRKPCPDERRSKTSDSRYHKNSFPDAGVAYATPSRREDARYYPKSSYYLSERR